MELIINLPCGKPENEQQCVFIAMNFVLTWLCHPPRTRRVGPPPPWSSWGAAQREESRGERADIPSALGEEPDGINLTSFYLLRSRQVLELWSLLLWREAVRHVVWAYWSIQYSGFIKSLWGGIHIIKLNQFSFAWLRFYKFSSGWDPASTLNRVVIRYKI